MTNEERARMPEFDRVFTLHGSSFHDLPGVRFAHWQSLQERLYTGAYECRREDLLESLDTSSILTGDLLVGSSSSGFRREFWRTSADVSVYASITRRVGFVHRRSHEPGGTSRATGTHSRSGAKCRD